MGFFSDALGIFGNEDLICDYRITVFGDRAAYLEGVKKIKGYAQDLIEISVGKGEIKIFGEGLFVKKYCGEDIAICGKIKGIERV